MMDEERRSVPPAPGASALLVIFAVLCLTVLAMLSLSTVQADAREGTVPPGVREEAGVYYYKCTVSSTQDLEVEVRVEGDAYTVLRWQMVPSGTWEPGDGPELWDGSLPEAES